MFSTVLFQVYLCVQQRRTLVSYAHTLQCSYQFLSEDYSGSIHRTNSLGVLIVPWWPFTNVYADCFITPPTHHMGLCHVSIQSMHAQSLNHVLTESKMAILTCTAQHTHLKTAPPFQSLLRLSSDILHMFL